MKKALKFGISALVILLIVGIGVSYLRFTGSGVHSFAGYTYVNISDTVYFVDSITEEVGEHTTVTIKGLIRPAKEAGTQDQFDGTMKCAQYPATDGENVLSAENADGRIIVRLRPIDGKGTQYLLQMSANDPDIYFVYINLADGSSMDAYPGETEEEAVENCRNYWSWFDGSLAG